MTKIFLLCLALVSAMLLTGAQNALLANESNTIYWGYPKKPLNHFGMAYQPETISMAIQVPGALLEGCTIKGINIVLPATQDLKNAKVWISKELPADYATGDILNKEIDFSTVTGKQPSDVLLDEPYTIGSENFYVGYTFTQSDTFTDGDSYFPLWVYDRAKELEGAFYMYTSMTFPMWFPMKGYGYGNAAIDLLLDITNCTAKGNVSLTELGTNTAKVGENPTFTINMTNNAGFVTDLDYTVVQDGKKSTKHLTLDEPLTRLQQVAPLTLEFDAPTQTGVMEVSASVDKVNGKDNAETVTNETEGNLVVISKEGTRRSVLESFTTMSDEREVLAMASYPLLKNSLGDKLIIINSHFTTDEENPDPTANEDYDEIGFALTDGILPLYIVDRKREINPYYGITGADANGLYHFTSDQVVSATNSIPCEADLQLTANWTDETMTSISATTNTTFYLNSSEPLYNIGFVLIENNVSYENSKQANALSADYEEDWGGGYMYKPENNKLFPDDDLKAFTEGPAVIENPVNDYIVRAAWSPKTGIEESVKSLVDGQEQTFTTTLNIEGKEVLNKENVKVVALLISLLDGSIVNAAEVSVNKKDTGISNTSANNQTEAVRYALDGRHLNAPAKGMNIVKMANGKVKKIVVR